MPRLTIKGNSVAVVTDGSAVLGLGNIGPGAALPVMEGKAALFKRFANIDAWPICLDTQDTDRIVDVVAAIAPGFGGINLEDIAAPRCFEIERRLRELLDIPVFHDDQHGTAIVVLAALTNALRCVDKQLGSIRVVVAGAGAAGTAIVTLLLAAGAEDVVVCDKDGRPVLRRRRTCLRPWPSWPAGRTRGGCAATCGRLSTAPTCSSASARPGVLEAEWIDEMAEKAIVFALANPDPEVDPAEASQRAAVVASGRSDYPNQINNVLAFPGVFRGLLDARARDITVDMLLRAADAIAHVVTDQELNASYIIPSVFDAKVPKAVAKAIQGIDVSAQAGISAFCAIPDRSPRIAAGSRKALCGVELSSPKVACTAALACCRVSDGSSTRSCLTHSSTYLRCVSRTFSRASSGSAPQSRSCTTISALCSRANVTCQSIRDSSASVGDAASRARCRPTASSSSLMLTSISARTASLDRKCR